jgi:hypothetical protein
MADDKDKKRDEPLQGAVRQKHKDFAEKMERPKPWPTPPIEEDHDSSQNDSDNE